MSIPNSFFSPLGNTKPYFKAALEGFAGSGKTRTSALIAVGLHQLIKSQKPVVIFDTEMSSKFLLPLFTENGIKVMVKESQSLADLKETMRLCREGYADILIIDSISHVWEDFLAAYARKVNRTSLQFQDWGIIKPTWKREFSTPFVHDPYHTIMTGRAGYEYGKELNEDTGKKELVKTGIKMKVEGETAYEPDLLVLMERYQEMDGGSIKRVDHTATIIKDRSTLLDGRSFENPTYTHFAPAIELIIKDPTKRSDVAEADASLLMKTEEDKREWTRRRDIALEKIEAYLTSIWPGQSAENKQMKIAALDYAFGSMSWTEITLKYPETLETGLQKLHEFVAQRIKDQQIEEEKPTPVKSKSSK